MQHKMCVCLHIGTPSEGRSNVIYLPGVTVLPLEIGCNVTGTSESLFWLIGHKIYSLDDINNGDAEGHSLNGTSILINSPINNTVYSCSSLTPGDVMMNNPIFLIIAGEHTLL